MWPDLQARSILVVDLVGFSRQDNRFQHRMRGGMYQVLDDALRTAMGKTTSELEGEDRGDSRFVLVPATVDMTRLVDPFIDRLAVELRQYNDGVSHKGRLRMRLSMHTGHLHQDHRGWSGEDLNTCFRLNNADPARTAMREHPECVLAVVVSDAVHHAVIKHGYGAIVTDDYREVRVRNKEADLTGWLRLVGVTPSTPPTDDGSPGAENAPPIPASSPDFRRTGSTFHSAVSFGGDNVNGDKHINTGNRP